MTKIFKILSRMAMMAVALYLPSCSKADDMPETTPVSEEVVLQTRFSITVSSNSSSTRASSYLGDDYDPGEGYENYIDIANGDFAFYFFTDDNKFITKLNVTSVIPEEQTDGSKKYWVLGSVDSKVFNTNDKVKVVALANWGSNNYPEEPESIDELAEIPYDFNADKMNLSSENKIPLYGVTNAEQLNFKPVSVDNDYLAEISMIHMLRAYAKVQVIADNHSTYFYDLESVTLTRYHNKGYCAPKGIYSQDDYVTGEYYTDNGDGINIPEDSEVYTDLRFMSASDGSFIAYIPEYKNVDREDDNKARMKLRFKNVDADFYLDFRYYNDVNNNEPFDVQRNYWYQYTVGLNDTKLEVTLDLTPYTSVELEPSFGINRDEDGNIIDNNGNKISFDGDGNQIFRDPSGNVFYIRKSDGETNIIAKCKIGEDKNAEIDREGNVILITSKSTKLCEGYDAQILIRNEYNAFKDNEGNTITNNGKDFSDDVYIVVKTDEHIYTLDSSGNVINTI